MTCILLEIHNLKQFDPSTYRVLSHKAIKVLPGNATFKGFPSLLLIIKIIKLINELIFK